MVIENLSSPHRFSGVMIMSLRWVFLPALLASLAACGTPQEQCIRRSTVELRKIERLIADTQGNLARGYAYETDTITTHHWVACVAPGWGVQGRPVRTTMCFEPQTRTIRREVPIDPAAEQRVLDNLLARRKALTAAAEPAISACRAAYPE